MKLDAMWVGIWSHFRAFSPINTFPYRTVDYQWIHNHHIEMWYARR